MTKRYFIMDGSSNELKDNDTYSTGKMSVEYESTIVYIAAYDVDGNVVTPSAGIATLSFTNMHQSLDAGVSDGDNPIDLTLTGATPSFNKPLYLGCCEEVSLTLSGVDFVTDGIDHFKAFAWRIK